MTPQGLTVVNTVNGVALKMPGQFQLLQSLASPLLNVLSATVFFTLRTLISTSMTSCII